MKKLLVTFTMLTSVVAFAECSVDVSKLEGLDFQSVPFCSFDVSNMGTQKTDSLKEVAQKYNELAGTCTCPGGDNGGDNDASRCAINRIEAKPVSGREGYSTLQSAGGVQN